MHDLRARRLRDFVMSVDVVEVDENAHRRCAGITRRPETALVGALSHHNELALKGGFAMHAAARRASAHLLLEAEGTAKEVKRRRHLAVEEIGNDLRVALGKWTSWRSFGG